MSTMHLRWTDAQRYIATDSRGYEVTIDGDRAPLGAKPSDLLPVSLAACVAYTMLQVLTKQRQVVGALEAAIEAEQQSEAPWMFTRIAVRFVVRGSVDQAKADKALALAHGKYCSVSASLHPDVEAVYSVETRAH